MADFGEHGRGRASIIPLSLGAPLPDEDPAVYDGEEAALNAAVAAIGALPGNRGLEARVAINPE